jgi:hypothetical protein
MRSGCTEGVNDPKVVSSRMTENAQRKVFNKNVAD